MNDKFKDWNFVQPDKDQQYAGKGSSSWNFKKSAANNLYNEGDRITNSHDPVWDLRTGGNPITKKHTPCGYWTNETIYVYWVFTSLTYPVANFDGMQAGISHIQSGIFRTLLREYNNYRPEAIDAGISSIRSGTKKKVLITYSNYRPEAIDAGISHIQSGTFSTP